MAGFYDTPSQCMKDFEKESSKLYNGYQALNELIELYKLKKYSYPM